MPLVDARGPGRVRGLLRPPRRRGLLARLPDRRRPSAAEDVTQEAFLSIWRSGARFDRARGSVRAWTLGHRPQPRDRRAAPRPRQGAEARLRRRRRCSRAGLGRADRRRGDPPRDRARASAARSRELPDEQSKVIELAYFGGFSHSEIAEMLGDAAGHGEGPDAAGDGEDSRRSLPRGSIVGTQDARAAEPRRPRRLRARGPRAARGRRARAALGRCEQCRDELRWLRPAVDLLPASVQRLDPPPELRERLMAEVRGDAERRAAAEGRRRAGGTSFCGRRSGCAGRGGDRRRRRRLPDRERQRRRRRSDTSAAHQGGSHRQPRPRRRLRRRCNSQGSASCRAGQVYQAWVQHGRHDRALIAVRRYGRRQPQRGDPRAPRRRRAGDGHPRAEGRQPPADRPPLVSVRFTPDGGPAPAAALGSATAWPETCYRHPNRETGVACSNCGRPICPDCMTPTPVGMRCPECAGQRTRVTTGTRAFGRSTSAPATYVLIANERDRLPDRGRGRDRRRQRRRQGDRRLRRPRERGRRRRVVPDRHQRLPPRRPLPPRASTCSPSTSSARLLEPAIGTPRFVALYFASLLAGSLGVILLEPDTTAVGASGGDLRAVHRGLHHRPRARAAGGRFAARHPARDQLRLHLRRARTSRSERTCSAPPVGRSRHS